MSIMDMKFFKFLGFKSKPKSPWDKFYKRHDMNITSPHKSLYRFLVDKASDMGYDDNIAITYFGKSRKYRDFFHEIDVAARAFKSQGIRERDVVTILSANVPEALISFML